MSESVTLAIKGGRYEDAERDLTKIVSDSPSEDNYFLLATVKSNLLLSGRSFEEVKYCYEKCYELSENRQQTEQNIISFNTLIYEQLEELIVNLRQQKKVQWASVAISTLITHTSAKHIEGSKSVIGNITGIVGASYGVGMFLGSLSKLGEIDDVIEFSENLKNMIISYLKGSIKIEQNLISDFLDKFEEKKNPNPLTDPNSPLNDPKHPSSLKDIFWLALCTAFIVYLIIALGSGGALESLGEEANGFILLVCGIPSYFIWKSEKFQDWRKKKYIKRYIVKRNPRKDPNADPELIKLMDKWDL